MAIHDFASFCLGGTGGTPAFSAHLAECNQGAVSGASSEGGSSEGGGVGLAVTDSFAGSTSGDSGVGGYSLSDLMAACNGNSEGPGIGIGVAGDGDGGDGGDGGE